MLTILDGGIGHQLKSKGIETLVPGLRYEDLFSAASLGNSLQPDVVRAVHQDYIDAGVDVLTSNNFACTKYSLGKVGRADMALELAEKAAKLAKEAALSSERPMLVAGSLPPLMESYQSQGQLEFEQLQPEYKELVAVLAPHVDLFLCETLSNISEGIAAATAAAGTGKPWWISWTIEDNGKALLRSGERLQDAVHAVAELPGLEAVLVNCCAPQAVTAALPVLRESAPEGLRIGGYANGFQRTTGEWLGEGCSSNGVFALPTKEYDGSGTIFPEVYARHAQRWIDLGATIVGGCCGVGPAHIAKLAEIKARLSFRHTA